MDCLVFNIKYPHPELLLLMIGRIYCPNLKPVSHQRHLDIIIPFVVWQSFLKRRGRS